MLPTAAAAAAAVVVVVAVVAAAALPSTMMRINRRAYETGRLTTNWRRTGESRDLLFFVLCVSVAPAGPRDQGAATQTAGIPPLFTDFESRARTQTHTHKKELSTLCVCVCVCLVRARRPLAGAGRSRDTVGDQWRARGDFPLCIVGRTPSERPTVSRRRRPQGARSRPRRVRRRTSLLARVVAAAAAAAAAAAGCSETGSVLGHESSREKNKRRPGFPEFGRPFVEDTRDIRSIRRVRAGARALYDRPTNDEIRRRR